MGEKKRQMKEQERVKDKEIKHTNPWSNHDNQRYSVLSWSLLLLCLSYDGPWRWKGERKVNERADCQKRNEVLTFHNTALVNSSSNWKIGYPVHKGFPCCWRSMLEWPTLLWEGAEKAKRREEKEKRERKK
jgi:hypothetical protein